jgi:hypothetical protein
LHDGKVYMDWISKMRRMRLRASEPGAPCIDLTSWYRFCSGCGTSASRCHKAGAATIQSQRTAMGQHRQSQSNNRQNTARQKSSKQQHADSDTASSRTGAARGPQQQQQDQGAGRSPRGSGDGTAPRAGSNRNADNPSLSANQQDRRGQSGSQRGGDSVEAPQDKEDSQDSER